MRIISGSARGTKLYTLEGELTRPTLDRVKESLFSIIQGNLPNAKVLDLFAGSGALALEAISRGANRAILCDSSRKAAAIVNLNIDKTKLADQTTLWNLDYKNALKKAFGENLKFDIIFLDPPYGKGYLANSIKQIVEFDLLSDDGIMIAETDVNKDIEDIKEIDCNIYDERQYGRVKLIFINKRGK